jgi:predicted nuclease with TOPRIM domain
MRGNENQNLLEEILKKNEELEHKVNVINNRLEEMEEDLTYITELLMKYQQRVEKGSKIDTLIVNVLLFTVGGLLGFSIALLLLK